MASHVMKPAQTFPAGTVVAVYEDLGETRRDGAPSTPVITTATVTANSVLTFTGLEYGTRYWAVAQVAGRWTWIGFATDEASTNQLADDLSSTDVRLEVVRESPLNLRAQEYAAAGDGTTDDSVVLTAFLAAVANAPKGSGYLPHGTYVVGDVSMPGEGLTLFGDGIGTVLKAKSGAAYILKNQGNRYQAFRDMVFDGNERASKGVLTESSAGATSQNQVFERCRFYRCDVGLHIGNGGLTQADKNTLIGPQFIECNVPLLNESVNGQETILVNADFTATYDTSVKMAGGTLRIIGGQFQGGSGTKGIDLIGSGVDWISLEDVIFEGPATDINGAAFWPRDGVLARNTVFQGATANVNVGVANARMTAEACRFNKSGIGSGEFNITATGFRLRLNQSDYAVPAFVGSQAATKRIYRDRFYENSASVIVMDESPFDTGASGIYRTRQGSVNALIGIDQPGLMMGTSLDAGIYRRAADVVGVKWMMSFENPIAAAAAPTNTLFRDLADGKLKFKDNSGTVNALY
jgi:hypothetical protein